MRSKENSRNANVKPDEQFHSDRARNARGTMARLFKKLLAQKWKLLVIIVCIFISSLFNILSPRVMGIAINEIYLGVQNAFAAGQVFQVNFETLGGVLSVLLGLYLLTSLFSYIQQNTMAGVSQNLTLTLRKEISAKLGRLPLRYFDNHKKGEVLSRATSDLEKVADTLQEGLSQLVTACFGIIGAFIMMLIISPWLTLIAVVSIFVSLIVAALVSKRTQRSFAANQEALGRLNSSIEESFTGNLVIKAFNLETQAVENTKVLNENLFQAGRKAMFMNYIISPVIRLINQFGYVAVAIGGAMSVIRGTISIGDIQAFIQYVNQASEPVTQISYTVNSLQGAIAAAERVFQLLDEPEELPDTENPLVVEAAKGTVCFDHVRFGYSEDHVLMKDISFTAKAGSKIAIVGPTGAGKTTLVNLLMRFYDIQSGKITIDGVDISKMSRSYLRSLMGMVLQDTWLFGGTIRENIAYSKADATDQEVRQAAKAARADHFIRTMPEGYETVLSDEIASLSAGQRQLLTIARAILANPAILILDEATSSVDTRTEREIQKAMDTLMKGRTSFIIAHRLSTIQDADLILVMNQGTIIEQGSHRELMKKGQFYADLYNSQFALTAG